MLTSRITVSSFLVAAMSVCACVLLSEAPAYARNDISAAKFHIAKQDQRSDKSLEVVDLLRQSEFIRPLARFISDVGNLLSLEKYNLKGHVSLAVDSYYPSSDCRERGVPEAIFYKNTKALGDTNRVLIVTNLPRAALSDLQALGPAAN